MKDLDKLKHLFEDLEKIVIKNQNKPKIGKMCILSMFKDRYENTHSYILQFLLHPKSEHQHGSEYLKLFLEELGLKELLMLNLDSTQIRREYHLSNNRRIDLFIEFNQDTCIIIENKIHAYDQNQQLSDYYQQIQAKGYKNIYVIYLTLEGHYPSDYSLGKSKEIFAKLELENKFLTISYKEQILRWLKKLTFRSMEYTLRSGIEQYIYLIERMICPRFIVQL